MKKITLLTLCLLALTFSNAQAGGDTCATAVVATEGSYVATLINDVTPGTNNGDAAWFAYTPAADGTINVNSCLGGADTLLNIYDDCAGAAVDGNDDDCFFQPDGMGDEYASQVDGFAVISGTTYYIEWTDRWSTDAFDWSITFTPPPACAAPTALTVDAATNLTVDFSWTAATGGVVSYDWEIVPQGNAQGVGVVDSGNTAGTSVMVAGLTPDTPYSIYLRSDCDVDGFSEYVGPEDFTTLAGPPPANDLCDGAFGATQETGIADAASANPVAGTVEFGAATDDLSDCFGGGNPSDDVWFSFEALTTSVNITVDPNFDAAITLYSGTCAALTELECADAGNPEEITAAGLSIGATYYFRVYNYPTSAAADPTFTYKLWSPETLSNVTFENDNTFKMFPNPVTDQLSVRAQNTIENVSVYNMLGQEVLRSAPNAISADLNMSGLQTGTYFARVTINNVTETVQILKR